jgi:FG-GAP-like repeat
MTTTPRLWKSLTQVNTSDAPVVAGGTASQVDGQIAPLQDGGYVVVWEDASRTYNPGGFAIVGQRYDAAGNKVGGEVQISQFNDGDQRSPAVTVLANGNIAVAFVDVFGFNGNIYVRIFDPALNLVRDDVIDRGADSTFDPSLTALADGGYVVSYTVPVGNVSPEVTDVVMRKVSATGLVSGELNIDNQTDRQIMSELATLSNGNIVAVYQDEFNGTVSDTDILYGIFTPAGTQVAGPANVTGAAGLGLETEPDVAALRDGGFVVVWTDPDSSVTDIRASILSNAGVAMVSEILVNTTTPGEQNEARVVALADGGFLVSWEDDNADLVRAQRFDAAGHKIGAEFTVKNGISPAIVESPQAAVLSDGRIAYAVGDFSTGDLDVMTSIWTTGWNAVATGDFNHDGVKDILWQSAAGSTSEWLMSPSGGVASVPFTPAVPGWSAVAGGDFNGDGTDDILWRNDATGTTAEWLMAPTGGVATMLNTLAAPGWNMIASGDFNGDGTDDLMWQNAVGTTSEWLMSPSGGIAVLPFTPAAPGWQPIASGDFNGDHITDLMWQQASTGATAEWLMAPTGGVGSLIGTPAALGWNVVATRDFNGDHITDLMWQQASTGATAEWLMAPTGGVGSMLSAPPAGGWKLIASGDFNGDGTDDVMWQNAATGATSEWLMANGGVASNPFTPAAPGWDVVATGHLNGDATTDVMWQNALNGTTAEWLMAPGGGVGAFVSTLTM